METQEASTVNDYPSLEKAIKAAVKRRLDVGRIVDKVCIPLALALGAAKRLNLSLEVYLCRLASDTKTSITVSDAPDVDPGKILFYGLDDASEGELVFIGKRGTVH